MQVSRVIRQIGIRQRSVVPKFGRATVLAFVVASGATVVLPAASQAQSLSWDTTTGDTAVVGGSGNWDAVTNGWTADAGATNETWTANSAATFGGTAGTVAVVGTQEVGNITFQTDGYQVTGGALTYTNSGTGIAVGTGTATIASDITSTTGLIKSGNGTLVLSGSNSFTGGLNVSRGDLVATNANALSGLTAVVLQSGSSEVNLDLGGASLTVNELIVNGTGQTTLSNGTVAIAPTGLAQFGFATIDAVIAGSGEIRKVFPYTTTLNGVNTATGAVNVTDGNLIIGATGSILNAGSITISALGTLNVDGSGNAISDNMAVNNSGNFILTGSDETVGSIFGSGNINLNANTLTTGDGTSVEISGVISGAGDLVKQGAGTLTLSGTNTYAGGTAINAGSVTTNNISALGTGTVTVNGGALTLAADLTIGALAGAGNVNNAGNLLTTGGNNASTTYSGVLSGSGGLTKTGSGEMTLNGANTYTGETIVNAGTLTAGSADAFGTGGTLRVVGIADLGGFTITKNSLIVQNGTTRNGTVNMTNSGQFQNATINTVLTGVGGITSSGPGTSTFSAANTFTGAITAGRGTLDITGSTVSTTVNITDAGNNGAGIIVRGNSLADTAAVTISNSGVLTVAANETIGSLASASATASVVLNADLTTGDAGDDIFAGVVSGAGDLIKQGAGIFTLSGVSTGTGTLVNNAGTVVLSGTWAGDVNNTAAGTFTTSGIVSGAVTTAGIMNANSGANLNGLVTVTAGTLNANGAVFNADLTIATGGTLDLDADTAVAGTVDLTGAVTNTGGGDKVLSGGQINASGTIAGGAGNTVTLEADLIEVRNGYSILNGGVIYDGDLRNAITTGPFTLSGTMLGNVFTAAGATTQFNAATNFGGFNLDVEAVTANVDIDAGIAVSNVGQFINTGTTDIGAGGSLTAVSVSNEGGAIINLGTGATLTGTGNTTDNAGTVNVAGGGALVEVTGDYNNLATGVVNFNDAASKDFDVQAGVITNDGTLNFNAGTTVVNSGGGAIQNTGTGDINIANNATLDAAGDTINNAGSIDMLGAGSVLTVGTLTNTTGGTVNARGALNGDVVNTGTGDFNALGTLTGIGSFTNESAATFDITGTATVDSLTNTTTSGTGTTIATFGTLFVNGAIENGIAAGTAASLITNNWNLIGSGTLTNHAGATLNSTALTSALLATDVTNNGTMNIQGRMDVDSITNNGSGATFTVVGNTYGGGAPSGTSPSPTPVGSFLNESGATLNVASGEVELSTLTNSSAGTGTTLATAGVQVQAAGIIDAASVANTGTGTINSAGTIRATTITNGDGTNAATLTNTGTLTSFATTGTGISNAVGSTLVSTGIIDADASADAAAFLNAGIADVAGTLSGNVTNTGDFEATGTLTHTGNFINSGTGTVAVTAGVMDTSGSFTNNSSVMGTTLGTAGVNIAAGAELEVQNVVNASGASIVVAGTLDTIAVANNAISNLGTLTFDATGVALGTISNAGTLSSTGQLNEGLINTGTATVSNQLLGIVSNNPGGQLNVAGNLTMNSILSNSAGGLVDVDAGSVTGVTILANNAGGTGAGAGTAGFEIDAGASVTAANVYNGASGTMYVAGTLIGTNGINNEGTAELTSVGTLGGDVLNNATLNLEGILDGALDNDGGTTTITGTLTGTGGAATGTVTNQNSAQFVMAPGSLITLDSLDNDVTSLVTLNGATIDGDVTNAGDLVGAGTVTGALDNSGAVDMADGLTGDELRIESGLISAGSYALDLDLVSGTPAADLLTVLGDTTGDLALQFAPLAGTVLLMDSPLIVVDVDDAAANDFTYTATGLPTGSGPVVVYASQAVPNGDIAINTGVSLTLGAMLEGVAQIEALTTQGAGRLDPHIPETCGGFGGWGRFTGGETTANSTTENGGQTGDLEVVSDHSGFELGANLGCASELGGWDLTYGVLGGMNSGTSTQSLAGDAPTMTAMDFEQLYGGVAGSLTNGALTVDAQLRFAQTDYTVDTATGSDGEALGLSSDTFATQTIGFAGAMNYRIPIGQSGFAVVPNGGVTIASTSVDAISFDTGETLAADDYTTTSGYVGATVQYETVAADGQSKFNAFVGANYYNSLSGAQNATLTDSADGQAIITTSGVDGYAEVSFGLDYVSQIDANRQFSMTLRADSRIADEVEGHAVALEVGLRF